MGSASSKTNGENYKQLYEPLNVYSPNTRYHALAVAMSDGGMVEITNDEYQDSVKYLEEKGVWDKKDGLK